MELDKDTINRLARMSDPLGVISVYVDADREESTDPNAWRLRLRHQLDKLQEHFGGEASREAQMALDRRLNELEPELRWLQDPSTHGIGRVLFAPLQTDEVYTISMQVKVKDLALCESTPYIRPLLSVWEKGSPTGIIAVSAGGVRFVDYRFGMAKDLATWEFHKPTQDWHEKKGPSPSSPAEPRQGVAHRDRFDAKYAEHVLHFLHTRHQLIDDYVRKNKWEYLLVTGESPLVDAILSRYDVPPGLTVGRSSQGVWEMPAAALVDAVAPDLEAARAETRRKYVREVLDRKDVVFGLDQTLTAIQQGQVGVLLINEAREWSGSRSNDGVYVSEGVVPPGADDKDLQPEERMGERLVELAMRNDTEVVVLDPQLADELGVQARGLAGLLRW
ncbi:MAG TPA: hypothetical protein H9902_04625 [Candidatus Stackebrandtia faecavium]|nr:hypothetical protein [Candidatus Stackebrandtia faecavium]